MPLNFAIKFILILLPALISVCGFQSPVEGYNLPPDSTKVLVSPLTSRVINLPTKGLPLSSFCDVLTTGARPT